MIERFTGAGVAREGISYCRETFTFNFPTAPVTLVTEFRNYYGPAMNAFDAAEKNGRAADLQKGLEALFTTQNRSANCEHFDPGDLPAGDGFSLRPVEIHKDDRVQSFPTLPVFPALQ